MKKKRKKYSTWTAEDVSKLVSLREKSVIIKECAVVLNKSVISVKKKLAEIKAGKVDAFGVKSHLPMARKNKRGLTWQIINQIRFDWMSGNYTAKQLKEKYNVNVWNILSNKVWKDPEYVPPKKKKRKNKENLCLDNTLLL